MSTAANQLPGDPIFRMMQRIKCQNCMDTNVATTLYGPEQCVECLGKRRGWTNPAVQLQQCVFARFKAGKIVETQTLSLARVLTHVTADDPLLLRHITHYWKIAERRAKEMISQLRGEWVLPIGSLREPPHGAYWIRTPDEFRAWSRAYRSQAITQLAIVYRMQRAWYPHLYGQGEIDFIEVVNGELREVL